MSTYHSPEHMQEYTRQWKARRRRELCRRAARVALFAVVVLCLAWSLAGCTSERDACTARGGAYTFSHYLAEHKNNHTTLTRIYTCRKVTP